MFPFLLDMLMIGGSLTLEMAKAEKAHMCRMLWRGSRTIPYAETSH